MLIATRTVNRSGAVTTTSAPGRPTWEHFALGCALGGPILFVIGQALLPELPEDLRAAFPHLLEHRDRLMASELLTAAGAFLLVPVVAVFAALTRPGGRGSRLVVVGSVVFAAGTFCNALSEAVEGYAVHAETAPGVEHSAGYAVVDGLGQPTLVGLPISFWSIPVFTLGFLLLGYALLRAGQVPTWQPVLLLVGILLAAASASRGPVVAVTMAPMVVGVLTLTRSSRKQGFGRFA